MKILVSACLLGDRVRYDGGSKFMEGILELEKQHELFGFCPEVEGGLPVPREPSELRGSAHSILFRGGLQETLEEGRRDEKADKGSDGVYMESEKDMTGFFLKGAVKALMFCREHGIEAAVLKERSPSCGKSRIYDGTFSGKVIPGMGLTAALLKENGICIYSEEDYHERLR